MCNVNVQRVMWRWQAQLHVYHIIAYYYYTLFSILYVCRIRIR